jgi:hypothetical protein
MIYDDVTDENFDHGHAAPHSITCEDLLGGKNLEERARPHIDRITEQK